MTDKHEREVHTAGQLVLFSKHQTTAIMDEAENEIVHWMGFDDSNIPKGTHRANARRLVAAWNACQGIEIETLETLQEHGVTLSTASPLVKARADEAEALLDEAKKVAEAALNYDAAIKECANDPDQMSSYCTGEGNNLDGLYFDLMSPASALLAKLEARKP